MLTIKNLTELNLKLKSKNFILAIALPFLLLDFVNSKIHASSTKKIIVPGIDYIRKIPKDEYILGVGDMIFIEVSKNAPELSGKYQIGLRGTIKIPRLEDIYVSGLTTTELENILNPAYKKFIKKPDVAIDILYHRSIKVYIDGEVVKPGLYSLKGENDPNNSAERIIEDETPLNYSYMDKGRSTIDQNLINTSRIQSMTSEAIINYQGFNTGTKSISSPVYYPTLFDVIRKAEGITPYSDLRNVKVRRINSISKGGGESEITVNFLDVLETGSFKNNIRIYDGDEVFIRKSDVKLPEQLSKSIKSNLSPRFINIFASGEFLTPGVIRANQNVSLNEFIDLAGGLEVLRGQIKLIRYKDDGTVINRKIRYSRRNKKGTKNNPTLLNGDIISVSRSNFKSATKVITESTAPITGIYSFIRLIDFF